MGIIKTINLTGFSSGSIVTYTLSFYNSGGGNATGVVVTDTLPTGLTGLWTSTGSFSGYTFSKTGLTLNAGQTGAITITGRVIIT